MPCTHAFPARPTPDASRHCRSRSRYPRWQARDTARRWLELIRQGVDPQQEAHRRAEEVRRAVELQHSKTSKRSVCGRRRGLLETQSRRASARRAQSGRIVRNVLIPAWGDKSVADITRRDVVATSGADRRRTLGAPMYAQAAFGTARTLFNWVINRQIYDLDTSPCDRIRVSELTSRRKQPRQRVLSDDELRRILESDRPDAVSVAAVAAYDFAHRRSARPKSPARAGAKSISSAGSGRCHQSASRAKRRTWCR